MSLQYFQRSRRSHCEAARPGRKQSKSKKKNTRLSGESNSQCLGGPRQVENHWRSTLRPDISKADDNFRMEQGPKVAADVERRRAASSLATLLKSARHEQVKSTENERRLRHNALQQEVAANAARMQQMREQRSDELAWRRKTALECRRHRECRHDTSLNGRADWCNQKSVTLVVDEVAKAANDELHASKARLAKLQAMRPSCHGRDRLSWQLHDLGSRLLAWQALDPKIFDEVLSQEVFSRWLNDTANDFGEVYDGEAIVEEADDNLSEGDEEDFMAWLVGQGDTLPEETQYRSLPPKQRSKTNNKTKQQGCSPYRLKPPRSFAPPPRV